MSSDQHVPYPSRARAWSFVVILFIASIVSVIDRAVLNIVVDPVRRDIGLTDVQIALLQGLAFGVFYAAVGLILGLTADRYSRRRLILAGMALWSCATVGAGFAHSFGALFLSRILVGLGEAALGPAAISLIADLFPAQKRGRPISVFLMGQAVAVGIAISVAGFILQAVHAGRFDGLSAVRGLAPWRMVFICCGGAGTLILALLFMMREPLRQTAPQTGRFLAQAQRCMAYMIRNAGIFLPLYLGFACVFAAAYGAGAWMPTMLVRRFGISNAQFGRWLGPLSLVLGVIGPMLGGLIADAQARANRNVDRLLVLSIAPLFAVPSALAVFAPGLRAAIVLVAAMTAVTALIGTMTFAALQSMVPGDMRGITIALTGVLNTVIGATLGPLLVAEFTQHLYGSPNLVGLAIATLAVPALGLGALCFACSWIALRRQVATHGEVARLLAMPLHPDAAPLDQAAVSSAK